MRLLSIVQLFEDIRRIVKEFLQFKSPLAFAILSIIIVFITIYSVFKYAIFPQRKKHKEEKSNLEKENRELVVLFAELDPDPIIRFNKSGKIEFVNPAAKEYGFEKYLGKNISDIIPTEFIKGNNTNENKTLLTLSGKKFILQYKRIESLGLSQIFFHDVTELKNYQAALEKAKNEAQEFSRQLQKTVEDERKRISRELHDSVGQKLIFLKLTLQKSYRKLTGSERSDEYLETEAILDDSINDLRTISYSLKPGVLEEMGLLPAIKSLIEKAKTKSGIKGELFCSGMQQPLGEELDTAIYRIVQEALNNIMKYSKADEFGVYMNFYKDSLRLVVEDNGKGFVKGQTGNKNGMGLKNMKERAEMFNGSLRIDSAINEGTIVSADFNLKEKKYA